MVRSAVSMSIHLRRPGRAGRTLPATLSPRLFEDLLRRDALLEEIFPLALEGPRGADPDALPAKDAAGGGHGPGGGGGGYPPPPGQGGPPPPGPTTGGKSRWRWCAQNSTAPGSRCRPAGRLPKW